MSHSLSSDSLPADVLYAVKVLCTRTPREDVAKAVKLLRTRAKLTQQQVGERFSRRSTAIANWEAGSKQPPQGMTQALLEFFQIPREAWFTTGEYDLDLSPKEYLTRGRVAVEYDYFMRTSPEVLAALKARSVGGSDPATKLYREWMIDIFTEHAAEVNKPRAIGDGKTQAVTDTWTRRALKQAKEGITTTTSSDSAIDDKSAVDATDVTPENVD